MRRLKTGLVLLALLPVSLLPGALLSGGDAGAVAVKLRPQVGAVGQIVQAAIARLSSQALPVTLDTSSGTLFVLGGTQGATPAPFNPDEVSRTIGTGADRRVEFNPASRVPLRDAVEAALLSELNLTALTPAAARIRFSGADLNGDGRVDAADLAILMGNFGRTGSNLPGDLNGDGRVDDLDVKLFSQEYQLP